MFHYIINPECFAFHSSRPPIHLSRDKCFAGEECRREGILTQATAFYFTVTAYAIVDCSYPRLPLKTLSNAFSEDLEILVHRRYDA